MNAPLPVSPAILKRLDKLAKERGCTAEHLANAMLKERLDYEARLEKEIEKGLVSLERERTYSTEEVFSAVARQRAARVKALSVSHSMDAHGKRSRAFASSRSGLIP